MIRYRIYDKPGNFCKIFSLFFFHAAVKIRTKEDGILWRAEDDKGGLRFSRSRRVLFIESCPRFRERS